MTVIGKIKEMRDKLGKLLWDFVTDKNNDGDEKRILGVISIILGYIYGWKAGADPAIFGVYLSFGGCLLGVAAFADKIPKGL